MLNIRRAEACEADILTNIAIKSEAYWDYDSAFMETSSLFIGLQKNL